MGFLLTQYPDEEGYYFKYLSESLESGKLTVVCDNGEKTTGSEFFGVEGIIKAVEVSSIFGNVRFKLPLVVPEEFCFVVLPPHLTNSPPQLLAVKHDETVVSSWLCSPTSSSISLQSNSSPMALAKDAISSITGSLTTGFLLFSTVVMKK
ncbi:hypothetical protein AVEN_228872-1 [Araneus ventricosus]|uniref:Uncharacterized protein n=1 Tax=Araneus ventricosus TaxID=182803 RepID=A0A4Y2UZ01_ARAVE|nr:hypothetical protein AVEN_160418-1 [Araneus ventricosus]GBO17662.1 hypothetical protein AVEN_228872-1 [Araneus ventricosus]